MMDVMSYLIQTILNPPYYGAYVGAVLLLAAIVSAILQVDKNLEEWRILKEEIGVVGRVKE
jgi:hypothetical protein